MLHDPSHVSVIPSEEDMSLSQKDINILRKLGHQIFEISQMEENAVNAELWTKLNDLKSVKPMVWINEIPWHEMNVDGELTLLCENEWARSIEDNLRKTIYQWKHMRGDMVVSPYIESPLAIYSTDFGIVEKTEIAVTDPVSDIYSRSFVKQISGMEDLEKIKLPKITHFRDISDKTFETLKAVFDGVIPVRQIGQTHIWYTPWDYLIRWWGVEDALMDLVLQPDLVHAAYEKMVSAWMTELDQFEEQNLLSLDCNNTRVGSGGYGYTNELPGADFDPERIRARNMWGCSNAQIFSTVSPDMHWEFALAHDMKWLERFGLTYYGCCEPLDNKIPLLRKIPNLRKISASPWCNSEKIVNEIAGDYVISRKPSPAIFVTESFDEHEAERQIKEFLDIARGCHVEIIMKDISTVRYKPQNLWRWAEIASQTAMKYSGC